MTSTAVLRSPALLGVLALSCASPRPAVPCAPSLVIARERASADQEPMLIVFGAARCSACRTFKQRTLPDPAVQALAGAFEWLYVDVDRQSSLAHGYGVRATPYVLVLEPDGSTRAGLVGNPGPAGMRAFLEAAAAVPVPGDAPPVQDAQEANERTQLTWTPKGYRGDSICFSHVGYGPFHIPSQSSASILRLALDPRTPSTLAKGQWELGWTETLTNFWAVKPGEFRLDYGAVYSTVSLGYGASDTWQVELQMIDYRRIGSRLDFLTNAVHDLLGLDDARRDDFPDNENVIVFETDQGTISSVEEQTYSDDVALTVQNNITCGTETLPALAWAVTARTNLDGSVPLEGDDDLSLGLSLSASRRFGERWYGYASVGHAWHGLDRWRGLPLVKQQPSLLLAAEYRYAPRRSWVAQYLFTGAVTHDVAPFDKPSHEFVLGWKAELKSGTVLELGLIENAFVFDNSPDVGLHIGLRHRF